MENFNTFAWILACWLVLQMLLEMLYNLDSKSEFVGTFFRYASELALLYFALNPIN